MSTVLQQGCKPQISVETARLSRLRVHVAWLAHCFRISGDVVKTFTSFDGIRIAYHDEGEGPAVILLHGGYVDGLGQFGEFERILPILEKLQEMFREALGGALPLPNPPLEGRPGVVRALLAAGVRTVLPDMRGFGASDKPQEKAAYANSAMARDVIALIEHLSLDAVDVIGFSMGGGTALRLLMLHPSQVKSAILAGIGDYTYCPGVAGGRSKNSREGGIGSRTPRVGQSHCGSGYRS
jgi:pimeloyl-ACP methyl ester carboxylesterase